jgi:hypothetical protein
MLIPSNKNLTEVIKILKPNIKQLVEDTNAVSGIFDTCNNLQLV